MGKKKEKRRMRNLFISELKIYELFFCSRIIQYGENQKIIETPADGFG
jgi:hypothetical protein